jgi:hypothetical protein
MKCRCIRCGGKGQVECVECDGSGLTDESIFTATLDKSHPRYEDLLELKKDAGRVTEQCRKLSEINPSRKESYESQLLAVMATLNKEAESILKK